ncbi:LA_1448 family UV-C exposure upregulated protein [Leptospira idonii]|uniref:Uncharacterized protein n=1 Tax=Leptospira idonii TaxID=1193500 RepID=A0A4R9M0F8_9LEPT|nr:hypothetical protein [Leptospira idonii]TGN20143.1 hypothetical protein EHS15_05465 [Leptospira idonii]
MTFPIQKPLTLLGVGLFLFLLHCAPQKETVSPYDLKRALERFSQNRIQTGLTADVDKPAPSDQVLFEEACTVYRLPIEKAKSALKEKNLALYESIYGN